MVDHELTDMGRAGAVELNSSQVRRIRRKDVVTVAGGRESDHDSRRRTNSQGNRNNRCNGSSLRVHQLGNQEQHDSVSPRINLNVFGQTDLQVVQVSGKHRIGHPSHTVHSHDGDGTSAEHAVLSHVRSLNIAEDNHQRTGSQHEHLNSQGHRAAFRTQFGEHTEDSHDNDHADEQAQREPLLARELLTDQGRRITVDILLHFRIGNQLLEFRILVEVLTTEPREAADSEHTEEAARNRDGEEVNEAEVLAIDRVTFHQSDHGNSSHSSRRADHTHLRGDRGTSHRAFRTDVVLNSHVIDNGQHRVNDVTRTAQDGQEPADVRSEEADVAGISTQNLFSDLEQAIQTTSGLQSSRTANHGQNREDHVDRRFTRFKAEAENGRDPNITGQPL